MKIGIPKEIKINENRVALVPVGAAALVAAGHAVIVETGAGLGSGLGDALYIAGKITHKKVAETFGLAYHAAEEMID